MVVKNEEHPIKHEGARVFTTLLIKFSDAQGQITPESVVVVSGQTLNSSKFSCMSSLPARLKMIQSKMKELEWSQHFSIISRWVFFFSDAQRQLTPQPLVRSGQISNLFETLWLSLLSAKMKKIQSSRWWYLAEIRTHSSFHACPRHLQE